MQKYAQNYCYLAPHWRVNALASMAVRLHIFLLRILILFYFEKCGTFSLWSCACCCSINWRIHSEWQKRRRALSCVCVCVFLLCYTQTHSHAHLHPLSNAAGCLDICVHMYVNVSVHFYSAV